MGFILQLVFETILFGLAAILLPLLTLGRVRVMGAVAAAKLKDADRRWHGVYRQPSGRIVLDENTAVLVVMLIAVCGLIAYLALTR